MSGLRSTIGIDPSPPSAADSGVPGDPGPEAHVRGLDRLHVLYKYRKVVISLTLLGLLAGIVQTYTTTTAYLATVIVRVEPDSPPATSVAIQTTDRIGIGDFLKSELAVIQSRDLKRRVVRQFRLDQNPVFEAPLGPGGLGGAFAALRAMIRKPLQGMLSSPPSVASAGASATAPPNAEPIETPAEARAIESITANLRIQPQPASHLFTIRFSSSSPELSANIANALATDYASESPGRRLERLERQRKIVANSVDELNARIEADRLTLLDATSDAASINNDMLARRASSAEADLDSKRTAMRAADKKAGEMAALDPNSPLDSAQAYPDVLSATAASRQEIATLTSDRSRVIKQGAGSNSVLVRAIDSQIARLQQDLKTEIRNQIDAARRDYEARRSDARIADLNLKAQQDLLVRNSRGGISYGTVKQDISTSTRHRDELLTQQKVLETSIRATANNITVVQYAQPPQRPYKPDPLRNILVSLAAGLALGLMLAFGLDRLDDTIKTPEDVTRKLHIPFLGLVPAVRGDRPPVLSGPVPHDFGESYRALRTSLVFTSGAETTRIITVTSAQPLEGKTTTACNLAMVLAFGGSRVLLIDADMRRPGVHKALKMVNTIGLSHLLVGQARVREAIQRTSDPNLCVMTAGRTPPVLAVTDAVVLTPLVDGVTLVLGAEMTRRGLAERAVQMLMTGRPKVIGVILNRVDFDSNKYYYSRYYGYQYKRYYGTEPAHVTTEVA